jgi:hypothetical protein
MRMETEAEALKYFGAAHFGECQSVDEFMRFWQNQWLRSEIHHQASIWANTREDYQDLWGEAWAAVCECAPGTSLDEIWHLENGRPTRGAAYRSMHNEYRAQKRWTQRYGTVAPIGQN